MRFVSCLVVMLASLCRPALAQDPPPPIPWAVVDLHGSMPRFPTDDADLAASRKMDIAELPGAGLGAQIGLHLYPLHTRVVTIGVGGEFAIGRATQTPPAGATVAGTKTLLRSAEERFTLLSPQLSLNFGNGSGWSYLSVGLGQATWSLEPDGLGDYPGNHDKLKTLNYGGGARWFIKKHLAFSLDFRIWQVDPGTPHFGFPPTPRANVFIISAGIALK